MDLVNATPLAAAARVATADAAAPRWCQLTAKASFGFSAEGEVWLDDQQPIPLFDRDVPTELGLLPRDDHPHAPGTFGVIALAAAYCDPPAPETRVHLAVGEERRELCVSGDRQWTDSGTIGAAEAFERMPLTYDRAFGGSADVLLDAESPLTVSHQMNPEGRGFDPQPQLEDLQKALSCPDGFPRVDPAFERKLPNVERPGELVARSEDEPFPAGWGAVATGSPLYVVPSLEAQVSGEEDPAAAIQRNAERDSEAPEVPLIHLYRCHPDWLIRPPPPGAMVELSGVTPERHPIRFALPALSVEVDYQLGAHAGTRPLEPFLLVLLADEKRFYLVYRMSFQYFLPPQDERSLRLRASRS